MHGVYSSFSSINIVPSERNRTATRRSSTRTRNSTFSAGTCDGPSYYNSSDVSTALMEQLRSLPVKTLRTQLERCLLPTSGSNVTMAARLHNCFTPPKARHLWIPTMLWSHPKTQTDNNNKQQKPAHLQETTCFLSNLLINCHLEIICFLSNLWVSCQIM